MFGFQKNIFLGVDVGTSTIKIVELRVIDNKPVLSNYAWMEMENAEMDFNANAFDTSYPEYLKVIVREGRFKKGWLSKTGTYISIPSFGGLITLIEFPEMKKEELDQAVRYEAHKYIPTSLDEVILSWDIVGKKGLGSQDNKKNIIEPKSVNPGKIQVLLVAAAKDKVLKYEKIVKSAGLSLRAIEMESFSITRALVGNDPGNFIIIDIGSRVCNIILVEKGEIKVNRNMDVGGRDITREISKSVNVDLERAEKLKISGKDFFANGSGIVFPILNLIVDEVKRVLNNYYQGNPSVDAIILSGGTSRLTGIDQYFSSALNIKAIIGNPFGRVGYDKRLEEKINEIKLNFSVAIGLALKGFEDNN